MLFFLNLKSKVIDLFCSLFHTVQNEKPGKRKIFSIGMGKSLWGGRNLPSPNSGLMSLFTKVSGNESPLFPYVPPGLETIASGWIVV